MYKKIFGIILLVAISTITSLNFINENKVVSALVLANIEALAGDEEFEIVCGRYEGACWTTDLNNFYNCEEYTMIHPCKFSGYKDDSCTSPC